ncbi:hypothetical protein BU24DRAFT_409796 [Aaosphaeria arxii CBS 175.79]|uniref:Lytic polysaccharide monooxygenase n=1 Tax=Aaosphaeria arxii CBS 175.79 TaxID=1450172 RepID=A0A6A5XU46_9PLEO|nr:uncharacterized protein BU24DRAFT_409796 [Aaosphaeria arxii CBS 175.79]KAF2016722.1 hypothetical protein BU24DRAFT_409796 [Aaosphaeria arxii CBS 175.79]
MSPCKSAILSALLLAASASLTTAAPTFPTNNGSCFELQATAHYDINTPIDNGDPHWLAHWVVLRSDGSVAYDRGPTNNTGSYIHSYPGDPILDFDWNFANNMASFQWYKDPIDNQTSLDFVFEGNSTWQCSSCMGCASFANASSSACIDLLVIFISESSVHFQRLQLATTRSLLLFERNDMHITPF